MKKYFLILISLIIVCTPTAMFLMHTIDDESGPELDPTLLTQPITPSSTTSSAQQSTKSKEKEKEKEKKEEHPSTSINAGITQQEIDVLDKLVKKIDSNKLSEIPDLTQAIEQLFRLTQHHFTLESKGTHFSRIPEDIVDKIYALSPLPDKAYYVYKHSKNAQSITQKILAFMENITDIQALSKLKFNQKIYDDITLLFTLTHATPNYIPLKDSNKLKSLKIINALFRKNKIWICASDNTLYSIDIDKKITTKKLSLPGNISANEYAPFDWFNNTIAVGTTSGTFIYNSSNDTFSLVEEKLTDNKYLYFYHSNKVVRIFYSIFGPKFNTIEFKNQNDVIITLDDILKKLPSLFTRDASLCFSRAIVRGNNLICDVDKLDTHISNNLSPHLIRTEDCISISITLSQILTKKNFQVQKSEVSAFNLFYQNNKHHILLRLSIEFDKAVCKVSSTYTPDIPLVKIAISNYHASDIINYHFSEDASKFIIVTTYGYIVYTREPFETLIQAIILKNKVSSILRPVISSLPQPRRWYQKYRVPLIVGAGFATLAITSIMYHYFKSKR